MQDTDSQGDFQYHTNCDKCGSSDAKAVYSSGTAFCFSCNTYFPNSEESEESPYRRKVTMNLVDGEYTILTKRGISLETVSKFGYKVGKYSGSSVHIAPYYNKDGVLVAQHLRFPDKRFLWIGDSKDICLYGQNLWQQGGKRVVVSEGELDALSISQMFGNKWPVVSIPSGAQSAKKYVKQHLEWLDSFDSVVLAFDTDDPGIKAAKECAMLFKAGKVKIANFSPYKDASDFLQAGEGSKLLQVVYQAADYRPDGIVKANDISFEDILKEDEIFSFDTPYPKLNEMLKGLRKGEVTTFAAGSGVGKSTLVRECAKHLLDAHNLTIGYVALEENIKKSILGLMAIDLNVPLGELFLNRGLVSEEQLKSSYDKLVNGGRLYLYDHFGSLDSENLIAKLRYLAIACSVDFIILDHISIVVSGIEDGDERRIIDNLMTNIKSLTESTGVGILAVTHLKVPDGTPHEEGGRVTLSHMRGSGSIKQLSDNVIGLERDQQGEDSDVSDIRILKNRLIGTLGPADVLMYNKKTGRLLPLEQNTVEEEMF